MASLFTLNRKCFIAISKFFCGTLYAKMSEDLQLTGKAKLTDNLRECGIYDDIDASAWKKKSVVDIKPVGNGRAVLKYLAPYVHRVAISDKRVVNVDETHVTYKVTPSGTKQAVVRRVPGETFVGSFVQHVLPSGFHKVRHYGWMNARKSIDIDEVRWLACAAMGILFVLSLNRKVKPLKLPALRCGNCGGEIKLLRVTRISNTALSDHSLAYLDSS